MSKRLSKAFFTPFRWAVWARVVAGTSWSSKDLTKRGLQALPRRSESKSKPLSTISEEISPRNSVASSLSEVGNANVVKHMWDWVRHVVAVLDHYEAAFRFDSRLDRSSLDKVSKEDRL